MAVRRLYAVLDAQRRISSTAVGRTASVAAEPLPLVGMLDQREEADGERVAGGLAAGGDQQVEEHEQLEVARRGARRRPSASIVPCTTAESMSSAGCAALLGDQPRAVLEHRGLRRLGARVALAEVAAVVVEGGVGPGEEPMAIVLRHAEQAGDRLQRQLGGDVEQKIAAPAGDDGVDDRGRARPAARPRWRRAPAATTLPRGEAPEALVARVVHHVQ